MSKKTFLKGAAILGIAGLIVQVMGAIFRIPLANLIGDVGMGYYQTVYPIYIFLLIFSTNGAPAAISKMTAEQFALGRPSEAHRIFKLSFIVMTIFGLVISVGLFLVARPLVSLINDEKVYFAMIAIAPALFLIPLMSVFRGYFQGMQDMAPTATSQLAEQAVRVATGLTLAFILLPKGLEYAAAGATLGTSIGPVLGILVLVTIYFYRKRKGSFSRDDASSGARESARSIIKTLMKITAVITIGVSILPIMNLADAGIVIRRLQDIGYASDPANALYGQLTGMAGPIINLPMALALSMALSLVPAITTAESTGDFDFLKLNVKLGLRTAMIIGVPCSFGLIILAEPIMRLLYPLRVESAVNASGCLIILATGIIFLCIAQTMAGILQGLGRSGIAVWSLLAGLLIKCISTYILTGMPLLNVNGAAVGSVLGYAAIAIISFTAVQALTGVKFDLILSVVKPFVSGIVMSIFVLAAYKLCAGFLGSSLSTVLAIGIGAAIYMVTLLKIKAIREDEIVMLPKGTKLVSLLKKLKMV